MKIYTKQGDEGQTGLFGGSRVSKDHLRIRCYGTLDELNAALGLLVAEGEGLKPEVKARLIRIQSELFQLGAELATPRGKDVTTALLSLAEVSALETEIDQMEKNLTPLKSFILPGGSRASAEAHVARTIARRAERELVALHSVEPQRPETLQYLNRLSDYLFVTARYLNHLNKVNDVPWTSPKPKL